MMQLTRDKESGAGSGVFDLTNQSRLGVLYFWVLSKFNLFLQSTIIHFYLFWSPKSV